jgi:hypothetical protein
VRSGAVEHRHLSDARSSTASGTGWWSDGAHTFCVECTPPPAPPRALLQEIGAILQAAAMIDTPLTVWELALGCGHTLRYRQHASLHAPDMSHTYCAPCSSLRKVSSVEQHTSTDDRLIQEADLRLQTRRAKDRVNMHRARLAAAQLRADELHVRLTVSDRRSQNYRHTVTRRTATGP